MSGVGTKRMDRGGAGEGVQGHSIPQYTEPKGLQLETGYKFSLGEHRGREGPGCLPRRVQGRHLQRSLQAPVEWSEGVSRDRASCRSHLNTQGGANQRAFLVL